MSQITTTTVTNDHLSVWGARIVDYNYGGKQVDFQDLMVSVSERRAASVEGEITPLSTRMKNRNTKLSALGAALADLSKQQAGFNSEAKGSDPTGDLDGKTITEINTLWQKAYGKDIPRDGNKVTKATCEAAVQLLKTEIDQLNNAASEDMTRLQGLVDRRDQSYSTATTLMQAIGDTRSSLIKNM